MRAITIDDFIETVEERRSSGSLPELVAPAAYDWARFVAEGRAARATADGGRWRIGQLAGLIVARYRARSLQRFAEEIGESYATVRRYRWVVKQCGPAARHRFPGLSFSHFQTVASLPDRLRWLARAERGGWSVDRLAREVRAAGPREEGEDETLPPITRASFESFARCVERLTRLDDREIASAGQAWLGGSLERIAADIEALRARLRAAMAATSRVRAPRMSARRTP